jgi:uncharacterized damage-inducible protein DinB
MRVYFCLFLQISTILMAQEKLPYSAIPPAPESLNGGAIIVRMTQGLGYRFYWASKDLRPKDLAYRPSEAAASTQETLQHIYSLSLMILNAASSLPNKRPLENIPEEYPALRQAILKNLEKAAQLFSEMNLETIQKIQVVFERKGKTSSFPIWNLLNGPLSDAIYHTGQLVSFRRTSGNPIQTGMNVFLGETKEMSPPNKK